MLQPIRDDISRIQNIVHFAKQCQRFYAHNKVMLNQIDEFLSPSNGYSSNRATRYYTRDSFLYRRINTALRQQNFQAILDFHFFLIDMQYQMQENYAQFSSLYYDGDIMTFYRGQRMSKEEIESLKENRRTGSLITVNSYLSTSINRDIAVTYIHKSSNEQLLPVICEINAEYKNPKINRRKPFSYIGHLSHYGYTELEVLFSVGSFFRVDDVDFNKVEKIYIIKLTFIYDEDHYIITDDYSVLKACSIEEKIFKTGDLLSKHAKLGDIKAYTFYQRFLSDDFSISIKAACYTGLGWLAFKQKQFDSAIVNQVKALKMNEQFNNENPSDYLFVTSHNCIGAVHKQQQQYLEALPFYHKADMKGSGIIPIDKYAFYNTFNNIASINIACIHKLQGNIEQAWSIYKNILSYQMNQSTRFHSATYLKIAEAGISEVVSSDNHNEYMKQISNCERFLNFSLNDMSSNYRRSIVSGALSIGLRFGNNEQNWNKAIDYYKKIIQISRKYIDVSNDDYYIVVKCHAQIAEIYRKQCNYILSIKYNSDGLNLCKSDDLEFYTIFYENMKTTYEQQLQQYNTSSSPDDIDSRISLDSSISPSLIYIHRTITILNFERSEFSFGQYKKIINPNLLKERNLKRCIAYCLLKVAALYYEQNKYDEIHKFIYRVRILISNEEEEEVEFICKNNLAYLDGKFDDIIHAYETSLTEHRNNAQPLCIGEDAFCYIAHLYGKKNDIDAEQQWYIKALTHFERHMFVCKHTQSCFVRMALFYQTKNDISSCIATYLKLVHHFLKYQQGTFQLQQQIVDIVEYILQQLKTNNEAQILILKRLVQIFSRQSDDIVLIDTDFRRIIDIYRKNKQQSWLAAHAYESYVNHILQHINRPFAPYIETIVPMFQQVIINYKLCDNSIGVFDTCPHLINIILKYSKERYQIISIFKQIGLDLEQKRLLKASLYLYEALRQFVYTHPAQMIFHDNDLIDYILIRHEVLIKQNNESVALIYHTIIRILQSHQEREPGFGLTHYLDLLQKYHMELAIIEPISAFDLYDNLLDTVLCRRSENFDKLLARIVNAMRDQPAELLKLLIKYHIDYIQLVRHVSKRISHPSDQSIMCEPFPQTRSNYMNSIMASFMKQAKKCFATSRSENSIIECWKKCMYFLLEVCSEYDDYLASCYVQLGDSRQATNVFDPIVYRDLALQYCPNACRRYLKYIYPQLQMREEIELLFADHFCLIEERKEIRPLEPVSY